MKKTYHGSCHCGAIKFEADIDLTAGTGKCNCSLCTKTRNWGVIVKPEDFRLLSGAESLRFYQFGTKSSQHPFCSHCGVRAFTQGNIPEIGGAFYSVQPGCLDDVDPADLINAPVHYADGRNNNWWQQPAETRHL